MTFHIGRIGITIERGNSPLYTIIEYPDYSNALPGHRAERQLKSMLSSEFPSIKDGQKIPAIKRLREIVRGITGHPTSLLWAKEAVERWYKK